MSGKSHAISVRLSQEDHEFLVAWERNGANTLSEKVRELVDLARSQASSASNSHTLTEITSQNLNGLMVRIHQAEREYTTHSDIVQSVLLLLPQLLAVLPNQLSPSLDDLMASERALSDLLFRFYSNLMRMALTEQGPGYDPSIVVDLFRELKPTLDALLSLPHIKSV